jgi:hypothetical protein
MHCGGDVRAVLALREDLSRLIIKQEPGKPVRDRCERRRLQTRDFFFEKCADTLMRPPCNNLAA